MEDKIKNMDAKELRNIFSSNIKKYRKLNNLTQMALAEKADISVGYLCALESGNKWGTPETIVKIAMSLNIRPYQLFVSEVSRKTELCMSDVLLLSQHLKSDIDERVSKFLEAHR